jgi:hypothetical protein
MYFSTQKKYDKVKAKQARIPFNPDKLKPKGYARLREYSLHLDTNTNKYKRCLFLQGEDSSKSYVIRSDSPEDFQDWITVMRLLVQDKPMRGRRGSIFSDGEDDKAAADGDASASSAANDPNMRESADRPATQEQPQPQQQQQPPPLTSVGSFSMSASRDTPARVDGE